MGSRRYQVFVAPGNDPDAPLPIPASPWHIGRRARIFLEHWDRLCEFAKTVDASAAHLLDECAAADGRTALPDESLARRIAFIDALIEAVKDAPPLVPEPSEEIPENYTNDEYVRMLCAVKSVIEESKRQRLPFDAWSE